MINCMYNSGVVCGERFCGGCGWDPAEERRRKGGGAVRLPKAEPAGIYAGALLTAYRKARELTNTELAKRLGVARSTLYGYNANRLRTPLALLEQLGREETTDENTPRL